MAVHVGEVADHLGKVPDIVVSEARLPKGTEIGLRDRGREAGEPGGVAELQAAQARRRRLRGLRSGG